MKRLGIATLGGLGTAALVFLTSLIAGPVFFLEAWQGPYVMYTTAFLVGATMTFACIPPSRRRR
jgi:hypothetical protein